MGESCSLSSSQNVSVYFQQLLRNRFQIPKASEFGEMTQNNSHYAVQRHWRAPILVPIESPYTTSYYWLIVTSLLSYTVSMLWPIIGQILASDKGFFTLTYPLGVIPSNIGITLPLQKLEGLSYQKLKTAWSYLHLSGQNARTWRNARQTDRQRTEMV